MDSREWQPIDARRGYEPDNIRIVCVAVNAAMSDWGEEVFWTVVHFAAGRSSQNRLTTKASKPISKPVYGSRGEVDETP